MIVGVLSFDSGPLLQLAQFHGCIQITPPARTEPCCSPVAVRCEETPGGVTLTLR